MKRKIGLVLEGGGAKGAYHLGVYKALMEMGYHFSGVAGTSIGALNGALIAQGDWKKAWDLWYYSSNNAAYGIDEETFKSIGKGHFNPENTKYAASFITDVIKGRGLDIESMKKLFLDIFNEDKIRKSKTELGIVTVKLPEFKSVELFKEDIPKGELFNYLIASANFPLFQTNNKMDGAYIDGGFKNNLPLNMLPMKDIYELIAVRTFAPGITRKLKSKDIKVTYIEPSKSLGSMLDFDRDKARRHLQLGYFDAYKKIKGYVGREFCIIPLKEDLVYITSMLQTADDRILLAAKVMGYKNVNPKRFVFEKLFPQIAYYLEMDLNTSYEVLIITFFEEVAMTLTMDRDKIYKADEFISIVRELFFIQHKNYSKYKNLPKIIQSNSFFSSFVKSDFFKFIMDIFFK